MVMNGVSININLPDYGHFSPEELTTKVRRFAMELISQREKSQDTPPCQYTTDDVDQLLTNRMQEIENGTAEFVSHEEVKAHIKALMA
jgi:hypothetical protein